MHTMDEALLLGSDTATANTLHVVLTASEQAELGASVKQLYQQWKQSRATLEERWSQCWQAYLCDQQTLYTEPDFNAADRSQVVRPVLYEAVETIHANILNNLFPAGEKFFAVQGKTEHDQQPAKLIEEFFQHKLEDLHFSDQYAQFLKQAIITGNSAAAVRWDHRRAMQPSVESIDLLGVPIGQKTVWREETVYNGPAFDVIDMFDFLVEPNALSFDEAMVIRRLTRRLSELEQSGLYQQLDQVKISLEESIDTHKLRKRHAFGLQEAVTKNELAPGSVELYEAWGDFQIGDTLYQNHVCTITQTGAVIRFAPNPYGQKPFVFTTFIPVPNEVYGIGAIEKSLGLQHTINTLTNQKLDVINISINNPFTYQVTDDVFDPDTVVTRPGALIPVKSHDTLRPVKYLNNFTVAFSEIADLKAEVQEATGAFKYFAGAGDSSLSKRTATEVSALIQGGAQKFSSVINHLEQTSLEPFLQLIFQQAQQSVDSRESFKVQHADGRICYEELAPELLQQTRCRFRIHGSQSIASKRQELDGLIAFIRLVKDSPEQLQNVNMLELYKRIYRRLGFKDEELIFQPADPQNP